VLKLKFASSVFHSCNSKTQICITGPQCVKLIPVVAFLNMFDVIALLGYYTNLIVGWWVGWLIGWFHFKIGYLPHFQGNARNMRVHSCIGNGVGCDLFPEKVK
jgi:hypothetical protein